MTVVLVWPHLWHSKVRMAEPQGRDPRLDNNMRCCRQFGQPGRSIAETCSGDAGLNSGMMHALIWILAAKRAAISNCTMGFLASAAVVKNAQLEKFHLRRVNEPGRRP